MSTNSTSPIPSWLVDETAIVESLARHEWMCRQLSTRRRDQANGDSFSYGAILRNIFDVSGPGDDRTPQSSGPRPVLEVLSDGLGYIEPNWYALESLDGSVNRLTVMTPSFVAQYKRRIRDNRSKLSRGARTQRAVGQLLYESTLFAMSGESIWLLSTAGPTESWALLSTDDDWPIPLKRGVEIPAASSSVAASLLAIATDVLWPSLLPDASSTECLSLVLLHTSLWHEAAGVWAFHAQFPAAKTIAPKPNVSLSALRALVAPPVCCLEDVTGWAYEREGLHRQRRQNVNFGYHCLGVTEPPQWDSDGIGSVPADRDRDTYIYDLPGDAPASVTTRLILRTAKGDGACTCNNWELIELAFAMVRIHWRHRPRSQVVEPSTVRLYATHILERVATSLAHDAAILDVVEQAVTAIRARPDLCETCARFADSLRLYWDLVQQNTAQG